MVVAFHSDTATTVECLKNEEIKGEDEKKEELERKEKEGKERLPNGGKV